MSTERQDRRSGSEAFAVADHLPLGRPFGVVESAPEPASRARPFGLSLADPPGPGVRLDPAELGYDEDAQVGLIRDGADMAPLSRHTTGWTSTVTQGGDGQTTNRDSDSDARED